ncbi:protein-L-isoaspartate(D-aspartate) O-methyltransferase [Nonomuraea helvata]|uniref:Protein-L-isoaspartate O-methyltransferase n=1 Tax=Nonomuraea helvata TaxID=37484 RepID=A0ABV5SDR7_9ACTN
MNPEELNVAMVNALASNGELTDEAWRAALLAVPRHLFVPAVAWAAPDDAPGYLIDRASNPDAWLKAAYADHAIITQFDDGATEISKGPGRYTSSLSAPGVVLDFLELLGADTNDRVLEIGTGPGWTAGLLTHRIGEGCVTSVEIDEEVFSTAVGNLREAGHRPHLVRGDGGRGWVRGAPYDRVHVTCGVFEVPYEWVRQTRCGGVIVLPWMPRYEPGYQLRLSVGPHGTASGNFTGYAGYMLLRSQRAAPPPFFEADFRSRSTEIDPVTVFRAGYGADVAIAGMLPDIAASVDRENGFQVWLWAGDSKAYVSGLEVWQAGSRNLWDEVERAFSQWTEWQRPELGRFGMRVTPSGQYVWLDSPDNPVTLPESMR